MLKNRLMPLSGVIFVVLVVISFFLTSSPDTSASAVSVLAYYRGHGTTVGVTALLIGLGVIAGLFFFGYLRDYLRQDRGSRWLASTAFGGAVVFAVSGAIATGAFAALADKPESLTPSTAQTLNLIQSDLTNGMAQAGLAVFYLATAAAIFRGKLLPAWLGWVSVVVGVVAASLFVTFIAFLATGLWILVVAYLLWARAGREETGAQGVPRPRSTPEAQEKQEKRYVTRS